MKHEQINLKNLNQGAIEDLFNNELDKVLRNINDLNCSPDAVREIKLSVKIKPSKDRLTALTQVSAVSKLAPTCPNEGSLFLSFMNNQPKAYINNAKQLTMEDMANEEK